MASNTFLASAANIWKIRSAVVSNGRVLSNVAAKVLRNVKF